MKEPNRGRELEERLKLVQAPPPNPHARVRAKDAALAEFTRVHAAANEPVVPRRGWIERLLALLRSGGAAAAGSGRSGRGPRTVLLGAVASLAVAAFGLMSVWPMLTGRHAVPTLDEPSGAPAETRPDTSAAPATADAAPANVGARQERDETPDETYLNALPDAVDVAPAPVPAPPDADIAAKAREEKFADEARAAESTMKRQGLRGDQPAAAAASAEGPKEDPALVTVTGARASAPAAAPPAIEAIRAEDIGEFPDTNVAESLQRKPSVDADRGARDRHEQYEVNPVRRTSDAAVSTFSVDVDTTSYSSLRKRLNSGELPRKESVRVEELINYFDYSWPLPESREQPFKPTVVVSDSPWGHGKKLVHIGIKGFQVDAKQRPDANLVALIDVSPSMNDVRRLPLVKESMRLLLSSLKPTDTVGIVVYGGAAAGVVLEPTKVSERHRIWEAIDTLKPVSATAGASGIRLAYELAGNHFRREGINRILLCTDDNYSAGIPGPIALRKFVAQQRDQGIFLSVLGFGVSNYQDEIAQALAKNGNGTVESVDTVDDARRALVEQATGELFTIAKDVKIQVEFNPAMVAEWRLLGYEARELKRGDFDHDKVVAGDIGSGHTATAIYEITPVAAKPAKAGRAMREYGYLKIRYKLPDGFRSRLIEQPIAVEQMALTDSLRRDVEFSTAVAGFAQLLRGGGYTGGLTFDDVIRQAEGAKGDDQYGYRTEFVQLVRKAQRAKGM